MTSLIHILMIWTVVGGSPTYQIYDWRSLGEFYSDARNFKTSEQMCHDAAAQLGLKKDKYRCVRSK